MRKGELLALRWIDIDFDGKLIYVRAAWKDREPLGGPRGGE
jgi:integrase